MAGKAPITQDLVLSGKRFIDTTIGNQGSPSSKPSFYQQTYPPWDSCSIFSVFEGWARSLNEADIL